MEGSMGKEMGKQNYKFGHVPAKLEFDNEADATGFWFAAAVFFAVVAAIVIVYRAGNSDLRTASNTVMPAAAQSDPITPAPILQLHINLGSGRG
jgi:hypothetical protein